MSWKLREGKNEIHPDLRAPKYADPDDYTIRMHHEGRFVELGSRKYFGGAINHFDFCNSDYMSMQEINSMSIELGHHKLGDKSVGLKYHFSLQHCDDCSCTKELVCDNDAMLLHNFVDEDRVVGIFVQHIPLKEFAPCDQIIRDGSINEENDDDNYGGDNDNGSSESDDDNSSVGDDKNEDGGNEMGSNSGDNNRAVDGNEADNFVPQNQTSSIDDGVININNELGSETDGSIDQSMGDDSQYSDKLQDSDYSLDDEMFEANVDKNVQWGIDSVGQNGSQRNTVFIVDGEGGGSCVCNQAYPLLFNPKTDMEDPKFQLGMCFSSTDIFRNAVKRHSMKHGRDIVFKKNDPGKVRVKCKDENCDWLVYASYMTGEKTMQVKTLHPEHTCSRKHKVHVANSKFVAEKYHDHIRTNPSWPVKAMVTVAQKECKLEFSRFQMYRARKRALENASGSEVEQFSRLWDYVEEIKRTNKDTTVRIKCHRGDDNVLRFRRIYICWGALKKGFLDGCRRLIGFDGCHLKSPSGGILLSAVGIDANNNMYPFAYAVVEKEKTETWEWFIGLLMTDLEITNSYEWTIMSDKQKGLVDVVDRLLPDAEHRFCVMHLYSNFKNSHRGLHLKEILWRAASATRICDFKLAMEKLKKADKKAFEWLSSRSPEHWSRAYFSSLPKCDILLNNLCESFNAMILPARDKPIITLLEMIRVRLMNRVHQQRDLINNSRGMLCPKIQKVLDELKKEAMAWSPEYNGRDEFEVNGANQQRHTVNLTEKSCSCRKWDLTGIPCKHAIAGIFYMHYRPEEYVSDCYKKETGVSSYTNLFRPLKGKDEWPETSWTKLHPPLIEKQPGRPKKNRKKQPGEANANGKGKLARRGTSNKCSICKEIGHNKKSCKRRNAQSVVSGDETTTEVPREIITENEENVHTVEDALANTNIENVPVESRPEVSRVHKLQGKRKLASSTEKHDSSSNTEKQNITKDIAIELTPSVIDASMKRKLPASISAQKKTSIPTTSKNTSLSAAPKKPPVPKVSKKPPVYAAPKKPLVRLVPKNPTTSSQVQGVL